MKQGRHLHRRLLSVLFASGLLVALTSGCGDASKTTGSSASSSSSSSSTTTTSSSIASHSETSTDLTTSAIPPGQSLRGDGDTDNPSDIDGNGDVDPGKDNDDDYPTAASYKFPDTDDKATFTYGHAPSVAEARALTSVVKRYYAAASAGDGAIACSLLLPAFARSVAETYGGVGGPAYLRGGKSCQAVMSMLFKHDREQLSEAITVVKVRVQGSTAQVVLSSRKMRASVVVLTRQAGSWRIGELIGQPLP